MQSPKVSVCIIAYNHGKYIGQCLESLVKQETDFPFEILVSDDCSGDNTAEIISQYAAQYPGIIKAFLHKKNLGASGCNNYLFVHEQASGKYIAHMDGDDYALPGKLQAQADFLDRNPLCNIVLHRVQYENIYTNEQKIDMIDVNRFPATGIDRSLLFCLMTTGVHSSKMYRAEIRKFELPPFGFIDFHINIEQMGDGNICFVNDKAYGVYRVGIGVASASTHTKQLLNESLRFFGKKYPTYRQYINTASLFLLLADIKNRRKTWTMQLKTFVKTFHYKSFINLARIINLYSMFRSPFA